MAIWRFVVLAIIITVVVLLVYHVENQPLRVPKSGVTMAGHAPLTIAMSGLYPPFNYYNERNELVGFDVDIAREVARRLNRKPELITTAWDGIIAGLMAKKFDLIIGSMAITDERLKSVSFSDPYYISGAQMVTRKGTTIADAADLKGKVVGVTVGETYAEYVQENIPGVKRVNSYKGGVPSLLLELRNKRIDAFVTDRLVGLAAIKQAGGAGAVLAGDLLYTERIGIAVRKEDTTLLAQVNAALAAMKEDGTYATISSEWFGMDISGEESKE